MIAERIRFSSAHVLVFVFGVGSLSISSGVVGSTCGVGSSGTTTGAAGAGPSGTTTGTTGGSGGVGGVGGVGGGVGVDV